MAREAELFDGSILEFPDDTPDEVIERVARQETLARSGRTDGSREQAEATRLATRAGMRPDEIKQQQAADYAAEVAADPYGVARRREAPQAPEPPPGAGVMWDGQTDEQRRNQRVQDVGFAQASREARAAEPGPAIGPIQGAEPTAANIAADLAAQPGYGLRGVRAGIRQVAGDITGSESLRRKGAQEASTVAMEREASNPQIDNEVVAGLYAGLQSLTRQAPAIAAGVLTGSPAVPLATIGADVGAEAYTRYRARGAEPALAGLAALGEGGVEILTEMAPMSFLVKRLGRVGAGEFLAGLLARELPTEQVATLAQDAIDTAVANPDKTWGQYLAERPSAAMHTALATVAQVGAMGAISAGVRRFAGDQLPAQPPPPAPDLAAGSSIPPQAPLQGPTAPATAQPPFADPQNVTLQAKPAQPQWKAPQAATVTGPGQTTVPQGAVVQGMPGPTQRAAQSAAAQIAMQEGVTQRAAQAGPDPMGAAAQVLAAQTEAADEGQANAPAAAPAGEARTEEGAAAPVDKPVVGYTAEGQPVTADPELRTPDGKFAAVETPAEDSRYPASLAGKEGGPYQVVGADKFTREERAAWAKQQRDKAAAERASIIGKPAAQDSLSGAAWEAKARKGAKAAKLRDLDAQIEAWDREAAASSTTTPSLPAAQSAESLPEVLKGVAKHRAEFTKVPPGLTQQQFREFHERRRASEEAIIDRLVPIAEREGIKVDQRNTSGSFMVTPEPGRPGKWRVTNLLEDGRPSGHMEFNNVREALRDVLVYGRVPDEQAEVPRETRPARTDQIGDQHKASKVEPAAKPDDDTDGFADKLPALQRGKAISTLNREMRFDGRAMPRKQGIREKVAAGAVIVMGVDGRRLQKPDGSFLGEDQIGKTGMDYAAHLIARRAQPNAAPPSPVAESQAPAQEAGDRGVAPAQAAALPQEDKTLTEQEFAEAAKIRPQDVAIGLAGESGPVSFQQRQMAESRLPQRARDRFTIVGIGTGASRRYWVVPTYAEYLRRRGAAPVVDKSPEMQGQPVDKPADLQGSDTHKDPGQPAEPVTAEVIREAVQKSADRTPLDLAGAKKNLLAMVDKAIAEAPNAEAIGLVREFKRGETGQITKVGESEAPDAKSEGGEAYRAWLADNIGYVKFDVPGDGTFSVLNLKDNLQQFRKRVEGSAGFKAAPKAPPKPPKLEGTITSNPAGTMRDMLVEGEMANGLALADELGAKLAYGAGRDGDVLIYTDAEEVKIGENTLLLGQAVRKAGGLVKRGETQGYDWHVIEPSTGMSAGSGKTAAIAVDKARDAIARLKQGGKTLAQYAAETAKKNKDAADQETLAKRAREQAQEKQDAVQAANVAEQEREDARRAREAQPNAAFTEAGREAAREDAAPEQPAAEQPQEPAAEAPAQPAAEQPPQATNQDPNQIERHQDARRMGEEAARNGLGRNAPPAFTRAERAQWTMGYDSAKEAAAQSPVEKPAEQPKAVSQPEPEPAPAKSEAVSQPEAPKAEAPAESLPADLSKYTVQVPAVDPKTGARGTITERADQAMTRVDEQLAKAKALLECLLS